MQEEGIGMVDGTGGKALDVTGLGRGERGRVLEVRGGGGVAGKLAAMGIAAGETIVKVSAAPLRGPVVIEKGALRVALGFGLARKVIVERLM